MGKQCLSQTTNYLKKNKKKGDKKMNEVFFIVMVIGTLAAQTISFRLFGKGALHVWYVLAVIFANIFALKIVAMFGVVIGCGVIYFATFLATDFMSEFYGKKEAQKLVYEGFFINICVLIWIQIFLRFIPHEECLWAIESYQTIFGFFTRITVASLTAYLVSQTHDVWAFEFWKKKFPDKLWIRNNASTTVSQLIDGILFHSIAFWGIFSLEILVGMLIASWFFKIAIAGVDTYFIYLAKSWWDRGLIAGQNNKHKRGDA